MHVFFQFPFAKEVWLLLPLKSPIHIAEEADFKTLVVRSREMICLPPTGIRAPVFLWICWSLWTARNKLIFEDKTVQPSEVATKWLATALEWDQAQSLDKSSRSEALPVRSAHRHVPRLPQTDALLLRRCRLGCFIEPSRYCLAFHQWANGIPLIRRPDHRECWLPSYGRIVGPPQRHHKSYGIRFSFSHLSDCATLIRAISSPNQLKEIYGVLKDIKSLSANFDSIVFNHISCSQNIEVDLLANQVLKVHWCPSCFSVD